MVSTLHCYWVYILASQPRGTLYIGVTNNILGRVELHRAGKGSTFTSRHGISMLVYFEEFARIDEAIQREKSLKRYLRTWKINLIEQSNPQWVDLFPGLASRNEFGAGVSGGLGPRDKPEDDT
jgi:putative endonuclease